MSSIFYVFGIIAVVANLYSVLTGGKPEQLLFTYKNMSDDDKHKNREKITAMYMLGILELSWLIYGCNYAPNSLYFSYYIIGLFVFAVFYRVFGFKTNRIYYTFTSAVAVICEVLLMYSCLN